jgi:hypothetical protein
MKLKLFSAHRKPLCCLLPKWQNPALKPGKRMAEAAAKDRRSSVKRFAVML